jgi:hypothetical protein
VPGFNAGETCHWLADTGEDVFVTDEHELLLQTLAV